MLWFIAIFIAAALCAPLDNPFLQPRGTAQCSYYRPAPAGLPRIRIDIDTTHEIPFSAGYPPVVTPPGGNPRNTVPLTQWTHGDRNHNLEYRMWREPSIGNGYRVTFEVQITGPININGQFLAESDLEPNVDPGFRSVARALALGSGRSGFARSTTFFIRVGDRHTNVRFSFIGDWQNM
uniref:AvrLm10B n=1 Tax=Leptosphaeria maculans TaxID=5022 RepID=A0A482ARH0_LEPMC|nr:AvrLm10B [Plenodomus lingam]